MTPSILDVIEAWLSGRPASADTLTSDGYMLRSDGVVIGRQEADDRAVLVPLDEADVRVGSTVRRHWRLVKAVLRNPERYTGGS